VAKSPKPHISKFFWNSLATRRRGCVSNCDKIIYEEFKAYRNTFSKIFLYTKGGMERKQENLNIVRRK